MQIKKGFKLIGDWLLLYFSLQTCGALVYSLLYTFHKFKLSFPFYWLLCKFSSLLEKLSNWLKRPKLDVATQWMNASTVSISFWTGFWNKDLNVIFGEDLLCRRTNKTRTKDPSFLPYVQIIIFLHSLSVQL